MANSRLSNYQNDKDKRTAANSNRYNRFAGDSKYTDFLKRLSGPEGRSNSSRGNVGFNRKFVRRYDSDGSGAVEDDELVKHILRAYDQGKEIDQGLILSSRNGAKVLEMINDVDANRDAVIDESEAIKAALYKNSDFSERELGDSSKTAVNMILNLNTNAVFVSELVNIVDRHPQNGIISDAEVSEFLSSHPALDQSGFVGEVLNQNENYLKIYQAISSIDFSSVDTDQETIDTLLNFREQGIDGAIVSQLKNSANAKAIHQTLELLDKNKDAQFSMRELAEALLENDLSDLHAFTLDFVLNSNNFQALKTRSQEIKNNFIDADGEVKAEELWTFIKGIKTTTGINDFQERFTLAKILGQETPLAKYINHLSDNEGLSLTEASLLEIELRSSEDKLLEAPLIEDFINDPDAMTAIRGSLDILDQNRDNQMSDNEFVSAVLALSRGDLVVVPETFEAFITTNPRVVELATVIDLIDSNADGYISELETVNLLLAERRGDMVIDDFVFDNFLAANPNLDKITKSLDLIDPNKDGFIELQEATEFEMAKRKGSFANHEQVFLDALKNSDGMGVYNALLGIVVEQKLDPDGNGLISFQNIADNYDDLNQANAYQSIADAYKFLDINEDGTITIEDLTQLENSGASKEEIVAAYQNIGIDVEKTSNIVNLPVLNSDEIFELGKEMLATISSDLEAKIAFLEAVSGTGASRNTLDFAEAKAAIDAIRNGSFDPNVYHDDNISSDVFSMNQEAVDYIKNLNLVDTDRNGEISERELVMGLLHMKAGREISGGLANSPQLIEILERNPNYGDFKAKIDASDVDVNDLLNADTLTLEMAARYSDTAAFDSLKEIVALTGAAADFEYLESQLALVDANGDRSIDDNDIFATMGALRAGDIEWSATIQTILDANQNLDFFIDLMDAYAPNGFMDGPLLTNFVNDFRLNRISIESSNLLLSILDDPSNFSSFFKALELLDPNQDEQISIEEDQFVWSFVGGIEVGKNAIVTSDDADYVAEFDFNGDGRIDQSDRDIVNAIVDVMRAF